MKHKDSGCLFIASCSQSVKWRPPAERSMGDTRGEFYLRGGHGFVVSGGVGLHPHPLVTPENAVVVQYRLQRLCVISAVFRSYKLYMSRNPVCDSFAKAETDASKAQCTDCGNAFTW